MSAVKKPQSSTVATSKKSVKNIVASVKTRATQLLKRRPHRSFQRTRRRDYARSLKLPGYWAFTNSVRKILWDNKRIFLLLVLIYAVLSAALVGLVSQDAYNELSDTLAEFNNELFQGDLGKLGQAGLLLTAGMVGALNETPTDAQTIFAALLALMVWLTTVWLLRAIMSGHRPRLRDGLYNGGAPLFSSVLIALLILVQLVPIALAGIAFWAAESTGLLVGGVESMLFWVVAGLLALLSVYWITSSALALVVVTLPGMYPMQAIKTAGDLVIGRRVRILLRLIWICLLFIVAWAAIMIPIVLFDTWLKSMWQAVEWLPVVPVALLVMGSLTIVTMAAYVYMLYRRIVDDDASPA